MDDQKFEGFEEPKENWSKLPHSLVNAFPMMKSLAEMKVVFYILRHTWGYHDTEKKITVDEFCNGRKRRDGTRIDNGTGLSKPSVIAGLKDAVSHGFIEVYIDGIDKARVKKYYSLRGKETLPQGLNNFTPVVKEVYSDQGKILERETKKASSPKGEPSPFSSLPEEPTAKPKSEYTKAMEKLEACFAIARGCPEPDWDNDPKGSNKRWRTPLAKVWRKYDKDTDLLARGVLAVTKKMVQDDLTFDAPDQIIKSLSSWLINQKNGSNGIGLTSEIFVAPATDTRKTLAELRAEQELQ